MYMGQVYLHLTLNCLCFFIHRFKHIFLVLKTTVQSHNICLGRLTRKIIFNYAVLSGDLVLQSD